MLDNKLFIRYNKINIKKGAIFKMPENNDKKKYLEAEGCLNKNASGVKAELFNNGDYFFDKNDIVQTRYEMLRSVKKDGYSINIASEMFGVSRISFYKTNKSFEEKGIIGLLPIKKGPKSPHKLTDEVLNFIINEKELETDIKSDDLAEKVKKVFDLKIHPRTIEKTLAVRKKKQ